MAEKPKVNSSSEKELDKIQDQFKEFDKQVQDMTLDRMNMAPKQETEQQTKLAQKDIENSKEIYLKPYRQVGSREKFNEDYRSKYEFATQFVQFIAENKEIIGEDLDIWTKPFAGMPAQWWKVPVNKPVWGPRHLAEQIASCRYHRLVMQQKTITGSDGMGQYYGSMSADTTIQRLDAVPVNNRKSIFMGKHEFA